MGSSLSSEESNDMESPTNTVTSRNDNETESEDICPIYVPINLITTRTPVEKPNGTKYIIDSTTFIDFECKEQNGYCEFELYAQKQEVANFFKKVDNCDQFCALPDSEDEELTKCTFEVQKLYHGVLINSILYLTEQQWNTLVFEEPNLLKCIVCEVTLSLLEGTDHVSKTTHIEKLSEFPPLDEFELSITRQIRNIYHCGVCNVVFSTNDSDDHFDSKEHSDKQLFAYNHAIDIVDSLAKNENKNNDCYHFNDNRIDDNGYSASSIYSDTDITSESVDFDYEYDFNEDENNDFKFSGPSYASMARKPKKHNIPSHIAVDTGSKVFEVPFKYWHMILVNKDNSYYCMACKLRQHIKFKSEHCIECAHLENVNKCTIVKRFQHHFIREVNDKLYHCGHCNQLQIKSDIEEHLECCHPIKGKILTTPLSTPSTSSYDNRNSNDTPISMTSDLGNKNNDNALMRPNDNAIMTPSNDDRNTLMTSEKQFNDRNKNNDNNIKKNDRNRISVDDFNKALAFLNANVTILMNGLTINVTLMAYNVLCVNDNGFYCGLCAVTCNPKVIKEHLSDVRHNTLFLMHPFLTQFGPHLIRNIHGDLHCTICNVLVIVNLINNHLIHSYHIGFLNKALNSGKIPPLPIYTPQNPGLINKQVIDTQMGINETKTAINETKIGPNEIKMGRNEIKTKRHESQIINETEIGLNETDESFEDKTFDVEAYVFVKLNGYLKITLTAYHSLTPVGDGTRYCFVCNQRVYLEDLNTHVGGREHEKNMNDNNFLEKYGNNLIRQSYTIYHCSKCNVILNNSKLDQHLTWPVHLESLREVNITKKQRKELVKTGEMKMYVIKTQKENIYLDAKEPEIKILFSAKIIDNKSLVKKNKLIMANNNLLKIKFEHWHGLVDQGDDLKCIICQINLSKDNLFMHITSEQHEKRLEKEFVKEYSSGFIREIDTVDVHCVICNMVIKRNKPSIDEHIFGKKHKKNLDLVKKNSFTTNSYSDCSEVVLHL